MKRILHLDASARPGRAGIDPHGSVTRLLTRRVVDRWQTLRPDTAVTYRDVGAAPPAPVSAAWIEAAFAPEAAHAPWMDEVLAESDQLIEEVRAADALVLGVPLYNFSVPSAFKAWIDNIIRIGRTVIVNPDSLDDPYTPLLADRPVILIVSRGGFGMNEGGPLAHMNHLEASVRTALGFIGLTSLHEVAVEYQELGGDLLASSLRNAETRLDELVMSLQSRAPARAPAVPQPLSA